MFHLTISLIKQNINNGGKQFECFLHIRSNKLKKMRAC